MKSIKTTDIVDPNIIQPFTANSLDFVQDNIKLVIQQVLGAVKDGDPVSRMILWGCVETDIGAGNFSCTAGAIIDDFGEIYTVPAVASTPTTALNSSFDRVTANDPTADPLTFTDGTPRNVHNVRTARYIDAASATDIISTYSSFTRVNQSLEKVVNIGDWDMDATPTLNVAHGLTLAQIRNIEVAILDDSGQIYKLETDFGLTGAADGYYWADATNVILNRLTGGAFDSLGFNATSFNRGYITIKYTV